MDETELDKTINVINEMKRVEHEINNVLWEIKKGKQITWGVKTWIKLKVCVKLLEQLQKQVRIEIDVEIKRMLDAWVELENELER